MKLKALASGLIFLTAGFSQVNAQQKEKVVLSRRIPVKDGS